jgi:hypothetical protein
VLRKIGGVIPGICHDPASLCFAFGDFERGHVDDPLRLGNLVRQILDHIVDRG